MASAAEATATVAPVLKAASSPAKAGEWKLAGRHFVVAVERVATVAFFRDVEGAYGGYEAVYKTWGVEAALLTANSTRKSLSQPRLGLDYLIAEGFTVGTALGYVRTGGKHGQPNEQLTLLAPRVGVFRVLAPRLALWVRFGFTFWSARSRHDNHDPVPHDDPVYEDEPAPPSVTETWTTFNFSLEPQLLFCLAPRVAVSASLFADTAISGTRSLDYATKFSPYSWSWETSSYGVSAGLTAIF